MTDPVAQIGRVMGCLHCGRGPIYARGWCQACYQRARRSNIDRGTWDPVERERHDHHVVCLCDEPDLGPGWCHRCHRIHPANIIAADVRTDAERCRRVWRTELGKVA